MAGAVVARVTAESYSKPYRVQEVLRTESEQEQQTSYPWAVPQSCDIPAPDTRCGRPPVPNNSVGFKCGKRQEYEAATQATLAMFAKSRELVSHVPDPDFSGIGALLDVTKQAVKEGLRRELEIVTDLGTEATLSCRV
ncbi:hypothetical protein CROQUDRAFT_93618 [Cronartium quercuum f. sp. fusiforme G11]|uniref:Uncharacterized protein n=1 Tax=Cronartium quercuum f. sp. fusiforme G11 TaxID=708437 RepID=A0A9P6NF07_9BASI|nr:hypothetical protein CROQUDRAFT_93618 [Cronartium quercuum f. sp. fusiforme G11]